MSGVYGASPNLTLRKPEWHELESSCNGCHAPNVTAVLETGYKVGDRGSAVNVFRLCGACVRILKANVSEFHLL